MAEAERKLWYKIKNRQLGIKFRRQQPTGNYIVDFICFDKRLIIEIDGGEHFENRNDEIRDRWFKKQGYRVLRFWNNEVLSNVKGVLELIRRNATLPLIPSRQGRGDLLPLP